MVFDIDRHFGCIFSVHELVDPSFKFQHGAPSRSTTALSSCLVYATQPLQVRQQLTFPVFKIYLNTRSNRKTHHRQSRWCESTIQVTSNDPPPSPRLLSATHSRYERRWTNCTRISNITVHTETRIF